MKLTRARAKHSPNANDTCGLDEGSEGAIRFDQSDRDGTLGNIPHRAVSPEENTVSKSAAATSVLPHSARSNYEKVSTCFAPAVPLATRS